MTMRRTSRWMRAVRAVVRTAGWVVMRVYALALIALIGYTSYRAFRYLTVTLILPVQAPPRITQLPRRLDIRVLETDRRAWAGLETVEHARSPLSHYHRLDGWIQPDRANNCTTSGCHPSLPHAEHKSSRAFLNMHATSMHCGVCHMNSQDGPLRLIWYDVTTGRACEPPAVLEIQKRLLRLRQSPPAPEAVTSERSALIRLLGTAAGAAQDGRALSVLAEHFAAGGANARIDPDLIETALTVLPQYFRGEYGAKLALVDPATGRPILEHPGSRDVVRDYLSGAHDMSDEARRRALDAIHTQRAKAPLTCHDCHRGDGRIDFAALGYSEARIADLTTSVVARMVEHIMNGQPFYMPTFLRPDVPAPSDPPQDGRTDMPPDVPPSESSKP